MDKQREGNKDWMARENGRIPSKGAQAAQRASAGLGATDHDAEIMAELVAMGIAVKPVPKSSERDKQ